eukprot:7076_1
MAVRWITKMLTNFKSNPPDGCFIEPTDDNLLDCTALIIGPENTPYANGFFYIKLVFPQDAPFKPPKVKFLTKIYHCNVNDRGGIWIDILHDNWSPALNISKILLTLKSFLLNPDTDSAMQMDAAKLYKQNKERYNKIATEWTQKYAAQSPIINKLYFGYNNKKQQIECDFSLKHLCSHQYSTENMRFIAFSTNDKLKLLNVDKNQYVLIDHDNTDSYSFVMNKELKYGQRIIIESYIECDNQHVNTVTMRCVGLYADFLTQTEYYMFINGYLTHNSNSDHVSIDILKLIFQYFWQYFVTLKLKQFGFDKPKESFIMLTCNEMQFLLENNEQDKQIKFFKQKLCDTFGIQKLHGDIVANRMSIERKTVFDNDYPKCIQGWIKIPYSWSVYISYKNDKHLFRFERDKDEYKIEIVKDKIINHFKMTNVSFRVQTVGKNSFYSHFIETDNDVIQWLIGVCDNCNVIMS